MEESHDALTAEDISLHIELNNNNLSTKWRNGDSCNIVDTCGSSVMPCNPSDKGISTGHQSSSNFQIINIDPCYVTAISSYKYETFKLSTAQLTRRALEHGPIAQLKAKTKLKRSRKPYDIPNRCSLSPKLHQCSTSSSNDHEANVCKLRGEVLNRSQSIRVMSMLDDEPSARRTPSPNLSRSRSLGDLRSLAKTTTVMFSSLQVQSDHSKELDEVSDVMSKLQVDEESKSVFQ